jgi:hypothetical protein
MSRPRLPVSIVCVANDIPVRERNLDRSIAEHLAEAPDTEYMPIDNTGGAFASAGAALNHGASKARHEHLVFVHQDVYLHSLRALEEAAGALARNPDIGMHGSVGITADGRIVGCMRDRILVLGERVSEPTDVDSLDEVLFMVPREALLREPLSEDPDLAWHAYAVEYGLRTRSHGRRVTAGDIPLTHNSLTINLARLDEAHRAVGRRYPELLPVRTTCGVISDGEPRTKPLQAHRWRYRWLKESLVAHRARRAAGSGRVVLNDIRNDIDDAMAATDGTLDVVNLVREAAATSEGISEPLQLVRRDRTVTITPMALEELAEAVASSRADRPLLITNLEVADLERLRDRLPDEPQRLLGYNDAIGCWALLGEATARAAGEQLSSRRATPFGMARVRPA